MRVSISTTVAMLLALGSCAQPSDVEEARSYAEDVEAYVLDLERRMDRRLDDLEGRVDDAETYALEACARLNC
jgi:hypothetical protein